MAHSNSSRLCLKLAALSVLLMGLFFFAGRGPRVRPAVAAPQVLTVQVEPQPQSPLQISSTSILSFDLFSPKIELIVTNTGGKGIRAFTVSRDVVTGAGGTIRASTLTNLTTQRKVLQPGQSKTDVVGEPYSQQPISRIIFSVDFVEFVNGETWGKDTNNSADRLAGQRAGGRAAHEHFRRLLAQKGASSLLEALTAEKNVLAPPQQNSPEWQDGFKNGAGLIRIRLNRARQEEGLGKVELQLRQNYDTLDGRPE